MNIKNQKEFDILYLCYNQPQTIVLCDLILNSEYEKLCNVDKIVLTYKDTKNKEKRLIIDDDFLISEVNQYDAGKIIPT